MMNSIKIRKLNDLENEEFLDIVKHLHPISLNDIGKVIEKIHDDTNNSIYIAEINGEIAGTTTIITEPKFIHNAGHVCHIEDMVLAPKYRGKKISKKIINELRDLTKNKCYKIIVDGDNILINAFQGCGFEKSSYTMVFHHGTVKFSDIEKSFIKTDNSIDFKIRELKEVDLDGGYLQALERLATVDIEDENTKHDRFIDIDSNPNYIIYVGEENGNVVGGTTLYLKPKFLEGGKLIGHIEDVAVAKKFGGKDYGKKIVLSLLKKAEALGCVKTILNCEKKLIPWYASLGFKKEKTGMRYPPKE